MTRTGPSGKRTWSFQFRLAGAGGRSVAGRPLEGGRRFRVTLGTWPAMSIKKARAVAADYQEKADAVIADPSTYNPNVLHELGIRHAVRPSPTIVMAESKVRPLFDVRSTRMRTYENLGEDIGRWEAECARANLTEMLANAAPQVRGLHGPVRHHRPGSGVAVLRRSVVRRRTLGQPRPLGFRLVLQRLARALQAARTRAIDSRRQAERRYRWLLVRGAMA